MWKITDKAKDYTTDNGDKNFQVKLKLKSRNTRKTGITALINCSHTYTYYDKTLVRQGNQNINTKHVLVYNPVNIVNTSFGVCSFL